MLEVTTSAKAKLEEILQLQQPEPGMAARLSASAEGKELHLAWDRERQGDQVVRSEQGESLLLIGPDAAPMVVARVMDYQEPPQGSGFVFLPGPD